MASLPSGMSVTQRSAWDMGGDVARQLRDAPVELEQLDGLM